MYDNKQDIETTEVFYKKYEWNHESLSIRDIIFKNNNMTGFLLRGTVVVKFDIVYIDKS